ncbi:fumarate reductase flavoprotein subunit [Lactobacillus colini]|uniref:Fumarate reductase flavoprotein subunit n=1 Tax=Lactobacillus colini TaxID=1819254 RepID=A0ABS4MBU5_9LACO|nr:FAD-binding protein [Lactobacillus colini]MBP2057156.1 fumarate reductase flavoprotein subunit [Lactobacillus colini]
MLPKQENYDVVIIGSGLSGQAAAAEAIDHNLKTLVIEQGRTTGGSGNYVEGVFAVESKMQKEQGITLTKKQILHDELEFSHYEADTRIWKDYIDQSAENIDWLKEHDVKFTKVATLGSGLDTWHMFDGLGNKAIHEGMQPYSESRGAEFVTSVQAIKLSLDEDKEINALVVKDYESGDEKAIYTKNVILASGGYLNNKSMLVHSSNNNAERIIPMNSGKSNGSGLKLAWDIGAKKFGMGMAMMFGGQIKEDTVPSYKFWKTDIGIATCEMAPLWVNEVGDRFVDESVFRIWSYAGNALIKQERTYAILDQATIDHFAEKELPRSLKPLSDRTKLTNLKEMIKNAEDKKLGFLTEADTIQELAKKLNLPNLVDTINNYNKLVDNKEDIEFGKDSKYLFSLKQGPYYAFELGIGAYCTMGGLRINRKNEVLDNNGRKIGGLYAVGSDASAVLVGDTYGVNVPGSEAGYCIYSGRVAAQEIAKK